MNLFASTANLLCSLSTFFLISSCALQPKQVSENQSFRNSFLKPKRQLASEKNKTFNNEFFYQTQSRAKNLLRENLEKASQKYYQAKLADAINQKIFRSKLSTTDLNELSLRVLDLGSKAQYNLIQKMSSKYATTLKETIESFEEADDLSYEISNFINELYLTKEVQDEMLGTLFSEKQDMLISKYVSLVKKTLREISGSIIENQADGVENFNYLLDRAELFILHKEALNNFYEKVLINNKDAYVVAPQDQNGKPLNEKYVWYLKSGITFYTTFNASMAIGPEGSAPTLFLFPRFYENLTGSLENDLAFIGVLAHEFGHIVAYPKDKATEKLFNPTKVELKAFKDEVLWPFFSCYAKTLKRTGKTEMYAGLHFDESRSDMFAHYVLAEIMKNNQISSSPQKYKSYINLFMSAASDQIKSEFDPHPNYLQRSRILTGECKLSPISPYYLFDDYGDIRKRFEN